MASSKKKSSLFISLLLLLLLVSAVRGAQSADRSTSAAGDGERVTVRTSGHGHGYSSHSGGGHTNGGGTSEHGGAGGVVDPRNLNARSHRSGGAASRAALGCSSLAVGGIVAVIHAVIFP